MSQIQTIIEERRFDRIQTWMSTGQGTNLPDVLKGIYFMDGNKLPDDSFTMDARWNSDSLTLFMGVFDPCDRNKGVIWLINRPSCIHK